MPDNGATQPAADKRRLERIRLLSPVHAFVGAERVTLVDISSGGVRLELTTSVAIGSPVEFELRHEGTRIRIAGVVVRCRLDRSVARDAIIYDTGVDFGDAPAATRTEIRAMIREISRSDIAARRKYARGRRNPSR